MRELNTTTCQQMDELSSSYFLKFSLIFTIFTCIALIPMLYKVTLSLWCSKSASLLHLNLRIILQSCLVGFFIHCCSRIMLHSIDLFNYFFLDPCDMIPNVWRCFCLRFTYAVGLWMTCTTVIPLVLERSIATGDRTGYEKRGIALGIALLGVQALCCAGHLWILYSGSKIEGVVMPYCMVARDSTVNVGEINGIITICVQVVSRLIFQLLMHLNEKFRKEYLDVPLSNRYQLNENISVMNVLKVFANISSIYLFMHAISFIGVLKLKYAVSLPVYFALVELNSSYPIYGMVIIFFMQRQWTKDKRRVSDKYQAHVSRDWRLHMTHSDIRPYMR